MKKIDEDKINAVGQTLGVEFSEAKQTRIQKIGKIIFGIIQGLLPLGSTFLGISLGSANSGYPYSPSFTPWDDFGQGLLFETVFHTGNGLFLLPKEKRFGLSRSQRFKIFIGNLILSFALFVISFGIHTNWWGTTPSNILYSAYESQKNSRRPEF